MLAPLLPNEAERLDALRSFGVLDTQPEQEYDDLTRLAAAICGTPIALVSLVDPCRQWFKSRVGLDATETHRDIAFCTHAIVQNNLFVVPDAAADVRFKDNPLVTGEPHIRFYAGMPLPTPEGHNLGTLCVIDRVPRTLTDVQVDALRVLARQVVAQLVLRQQLRSTEFELQQHETFRVLFEHSSDAHLIFDERDGIIDCNNAAVAMLRCQHKNEVLALHPAILSPEFQPCGRRSLEKCIDMDAAARRDGYHRFDWTHRRADGEEFPCGVTLTPVELHGRSVLLVVWHDLTERKKAEDALRDEQERFRAFMDSGPAAAFMKDEDGRMLYFNELIRQRFEIKDDADWIGKTDAELWPDDVARTLRQNDVSVLTSGKTLKAMESVSTSDGTSSHWQVFKFPFTDISGKRFLAGMAVDVTAEKLAEDALRQSEERFRSVVEELAEGVVLLDRESRKVLRSNRAFLDLLGYTTDELATLTQYNFVAHDKSDIDAKMTEIVNRGRTSIGFRKYRRKDGSVVNVTVSGSLLTLDGRAVLCLIVQDRTEQVEYENRLFEYHSELEDANTKLKALATTDGLTGVKNRGAFNDKLAEEYDRAIRHGRSLSVILMDVDYFKLFNDTFGHPAGDDVLKAVAATLQRTARSVDTVARYGGEEFAVILPDTDFSGAMVVAERCRRAIAGEPWDKRPITVSVGVATFTKTTTDAATLVKEADDALYRSKQAGRNRVNHGSGAISMLAMTRT